MRAYIGSLVAILCNACAPGGDAPVDSGSDDDEEQDLETCPELFKQHRFPEYQVDLDPAERTALEDEFLHRAEREAAGLDPTPYHPVRLRIDGVEVPDAMLRLKGNTSWDQAVELDDPPKMQFVISFNEVDPGARYQGLRKVELDMPRTDASFLRQRLALRALRAMGIPAQCANSARLVIDGEYYGLYTHLERLDKEFLERVFPGADDGNLWKGGWTIETNEDSYSWEALEAFWEAPDTATLAGLADLQAAVTEWAAEAVVPHGDGYYFGRPNYFLYEHPASGFLWLPHDLDSALDYRPADVSPLTPVPPTDDLVRQHWDLVLADPAWLDRYVDALEAMLAAYDVDDLERRVDSWSQQIAEAAEADPNRPFSITTHHQALLALRGYMRDRAGFLAGWLDCRRRGGTGCE